MLTGMEVNEREASMNVNINLLLLVPLILDSRLRWRIFLEASLCRPCAPAGVCMFR